MTPVLADSTHLRGSGGRWEAAPAAADTKPFRLPRIWPYAYFRFIDSFCNNAP